VNNDIISIPSLCVMHVQAT